MFLFYFSIGLTVAASVVCHIAQKLTPAQSNPVLSLSVTSFVAAVLCLPLLPVFPLNAGLLASIRQPRWPALALAVAAIGLELGFLLAYRASWKVNLAGNRFEWN